VRVLPLFICGLLVAPLAEAISFQTRLEHASWSVEGDEFECRLSQPVALFGSGEFVRRAGERPTFRLTSREPWLETGTATLLAAAAPWQPGRGDINLGRVTVARGAVPFNSSEQQAGRLMTGLLQGRSPVVRHHNAVAGEAVEVRLLPARFSKAYEEFQACASKLLPVNFDQVRVSQIGFPDGGAALNPSAQGMLDLILQYMQADPTVNRVVLDGHSDNSGNRLTNRDLSRRRGVTVMDYLIANGVPEEQITLRFHGEQYPLVPNSNAANRAKNRRVTLRLEREPVVVASGDKAAPASTTEDQPQD
jgi:outer membrane protein OmpA-like peptidoglycan-associated protein